jgi:hypothetical protein
MQVFISIVEHRGSSKKLLTFKSLVFFFINVGIRGSLRVPQLILLVLKLTTM